VESTIGRGGTTPWRTRFKSGWSEEIRRNLVENLQTEKKAPCRSDWLNPNGRVIIRYELKWRSMVGCKGNSGELGSGVEGGGGCDAKSAQAR